MLSLSLRRSGLLWAASIAALVVLAGCAKKDNTPPPAPAAPDGKAAPVQRSQKRDPDAPTKG